MVKKEEVISKLYDNLELTGDELIFVARNLDGGVEVPRTSTMPFDHTLDNPLIACGLEEKDCNELNNTFNEVLSREEIKASSEAVEALEAIIKDNPRYIRLVLLNTIRHASEQNAKDQLMKKLGPLGGLFLGGGDLGELLKRLGMQKPPEDNID